MTVGEVLDFLDMKFPLSLAEDYDNCGLLVGSYDSEVTSGVVALDCTREVVEYAKSVGANLIVTHHPILFNGVKKLPSDSIEYLLASYGINLISFHTNLDVADGGINDELSKVLEICDAEILSIDGFALRMGILKNEMSPDAFAKHVSERLNTTVKYVSGKSNVKYVAVCSGSGGEFADTVFSCGADAFVTADIKHHVFIDAENCGYTLIDAGHRATEEIIVKPLCDLLNENFGSFTPFISKTIKYI